MSIVKDLFLVFLFLVIVMNYLFLYKKFVNQRKYFIKTLNHDMKVSILAQIRGLELLQKAGENELVSDIKDSCNYTLDMINMLLNTYRFEDGEQILNYEPFNFSELMIDACNFVQKYALEKNITFSYNFQKQAYIEADETFLFKALVILLAVSIYYADRNSVINLHFKKSSGMFKASIVYNGKTLTEEERRRMFLKNPRFSTVGHGIKMYLCKKIIEFHGGNIMALNGNERKNSFVFTLPELKKKQRVKTLLVQGMQGLRLN